MIRLTDFPDDILEDVFHAMRGLICFPREQDDTESQGLHHSYEYSDEAFRSDGDGDDDDDAPRNRPVPLWANVIALSHVCSRWRSLMLTRPRLWNFIRITGTFTNRIMVNEMLERAGPVFPLTVLFTSPARHAPHVYDLLAIGSLVGDHSARIDALGIVLRPDHTALVLDSLACYPMPRLEKLWLDPDAGPSALTGVPLFERAMPPLRVLHAHHIGIPWLPFEGLVSLELSNGPAPPLPALLHTLRCSPQLEVLSLHVPSDRALPTDGSDGLADDAAGPRADLPCLRQLTLQADKWHRGAFAVLPHITFPPTAVVALRLSGQVDSALYEGCSSLEALARGVEHVVLIVDQAPGRAGPVACLSSAEPGPALCVEYDVSAAEGHPLQSRQKDMDPNANADEPIARLCEGFRAVPLPALQSLSLGIMAFSHPSEFEAGRCVALFSSVPSITKLVVHIHPEHTSCLFAALAAPEFHEGEQGEEEANTQEKGSCSLVCPNLQRLVITWWERPRVDDFWSIERCCYARANAGLRIECIETVAFPSIVQSNLEKSVGSIGVLSAW